MLGVIGDTVAEYHVANKRRRWQYLPVSGKVFGETEDQFIHANRQRIAFEQGLVATAVLVGDHAVEALPHRIVPGAFNAVNRDGDTSARSAQRGVEHMCRQSAHDLPLFRFLSMSRMIIRESVVSVTRGRELTIVSNKIRAEAGDSDFRAI